MSEISKNKNKKNRETRMTGICPQSSDLYIKSKSTKISKWNGLTETAYKIR